MTGRARIMVLKCPEPLSKCSLFHWSVGNGVWKRMGERSDTDDSCFLNPVSVTLFALYNTSFCGQRKGASSWTNTPGGDLLMQHYLTFWWAQKVCFNLTQMGEAKSVGLITPGLKPRNSLVSRWYCRTQMTDYHVVWSYYPYKQLFPSFWPHSAHTGSL